MIYEEFGIDPTRLKRDYIKFPLKQNSKNKYEKPNIDDLRYLFLSLNIERKIITAYFKVSEATIKRWIRFYSLQKNKQLSNKNVSKSVEKKYGVKYYPQHKNYLKKCQKTSLKKYNETHWLKSQTILNKQATTNLERYGVKNPGQSEEVKNKIKQTNLERYGYESYSKTKAFSAMLKDKKELIQRKVYNTKKYNKSFKISKQEDRFYDMLVQKFPGTKRQYKSELYPFACDFYVSEKDLYIECNFHWTHGKESFNKNNTEHTNKVKLWKSKNTKFYDIAIEVWTIRDPLKRKTAKENNLNWVEFFNLEEAERWLTSIDK